MTDPNPAQHGGRLARRRDSTLWPFGLMPAFVLVLVNFIDGAETSILPGTLSLLQDDFGFSDTVGGALATATALAGLVVVLPAGYIADHYKRTRTLALVVVAWSALSVLSAAALTFAMFAAARFAMGAANSLDNPPASSLIADYYPPVSRGRVFAVQRLAWSIGVGVGIAVGGVVGGAFGWRAAYLVFAGPGLVVALLVGLLAEPRRGALDHLRTTDGDSDAANDLLVEMELGETSPTRQTVGEYLEGVRELTRIPTARRLYVGLGVAMAGFNGVAFWLPSFLERVHDLSEGAAGAVTGGLVVVVALSGALIGGLLGDRAASDGGGGRLTITGVALAGGAVVAAIAFPVPAVGPQMALFAVGAFLISMAIPNFAAAIAEVVPAHRRGTGFSLFYFVTILGGALGPLFIGGVSDLTGSLTTAMALAMLPAVPGGLYVLGARHTLVADAHDAMGREPPPR